MDDAAAGESVHILYGKSGLQIRLPRDAQATVIGKRPMAKLPDPRAAVHDALARPIDAPAFDVLARGTLARRRGFRSSWSG